jgi:aspartate/methionine/tyrosine aminotransferase
MQTPRIDFFEWLLQHAPHASYNLAFSNIHGVTIQEYKALSKYQFSDGFELGSNAQYGAEELKQTLCSMYQCEPNNIVTTTGATEGNFLVYSSLLSPGAEFLIEQPGYPPMWLTPEMLGARKIPFQRTFENSFKVDVETMSDSINKKTKLIVLTNLHNPSGVLIDRETIETIAQIASKYGAYVLVDEIFLHGSFTSVSSSFGIPNVIVTASATKIFGLGGLHSGWIIAPQEIAKQCQKIKAHTTGAASYTSEILTAHIMRVARDALIERFHKRAKPNFEYVKKWMNDHSEFFEWIPPDGGIVCFPRYTLKMSSVDLCQSLLVSQKLLLNPGLYFNQDGFVRLSYGCEFSVLKDALNALENGLKQVSN